DAADLAPTGHGVVRGAGLRQERHELVQLVGDDGGVLREIVAGGVGRGPAREPGGDPGGDDERPERDGHHRDGGPGAEVPRPARHVLAPAGRGASSRYPTPRTVVMVAASPSFLRTCAMCTSTVRASPNQS